MISWFDHTGAQRHRSSRTTDKRVAERIAAKLEADAALRRDGVIDARAEEQQRQRDLPIKKHLTDFESKMVAEQRTEKHIAGTLRMIRSLAEAQELIVLADITADHVNRYAEKMKGQGRSARTIQSHLTAIKSFTRWLALDGKLTPDPLARVKKPNPKTDRRLERRMLLPEEFNWLVSVTEYEPERYGMTGHERALLYIFAVQTGLRSSEIRAVRRSQLYLDGDAPNVVCRAGSTKNRKEACQYLQPSLAAALADDLRQKAPSAAVFHLPANYEMARMLREDLAAARREWIGQARHDPEEHRRREQTDFLADASHDGERVDFHALRHTTGAWASMAGAHPKEVQTLMRHSTIMVTMDVYGHLFPGQAASTVRRMPEMMMSRRDGLRATGTDGPA